MDLAKGFSVRNVAAGKISFGLRWTNLMKATINLAQDFRRISQTPSLIGISNAAKSRAVIEAAIQKARIKTHSGWEEDITSNKNMGVILGGPYIMWIPPWGSTVSFRPDYMPMIPDNPRSAAQCVRDEFLCQRRHNCMQSPSIILFDTIKGAGGAIFTGFYPNWSKILEGEKQSIFEDK